MLTFNEKDGKIQVGSSGAGIISLNQKQGLDKIALLWFNKNKPQAPISDPDYNENTAREATDPALLQKLLSYGRDDVVSQTAAINPYCPPETLEKIITDGLKKRGTMTMIFALKNPKCPPYALAQVIRRKIPDEVTKEALKHENVPTGVVMEVADGCKDDQLLAMIVRSPNCPQEVHDKIVTSDRTKIAASVSAKKCSEAALVKVLSSFTNDNVSFAALNNPNVTGAMIYAILQRGEDDQLSRIAAGHPKCPPDTIEMVLSRNRKDKTSEILAWRKECPQPMRAAWMENTGQLKKRLSPEEIAAEKEKAERRRIIDEIRVM